MASDFWSKRLAPQQPAQMAPPAPSNRPWWQPGVAPQSTSAPIAVTPQPQPQQASVAPVGETHFGDLLLQDDYTSTKAQSARDKETCPDCQSPNYMAPQGHPNAMKQCFDCGWNPRFQHSTHGASGIGQQNLPTRTARGQTLSTNNFNPQAIVGRVG
jgi:hypothetical protein